MSDSSSDQPALFPMGEPRKESKDAGEASDAGAPSTFPEYVEVAIPAPLRQRFTYGVKDALVGTLEPGMRVAVPFGRRKVPAFVLGTVEAPPEGVKRIRAVATRLEEEPVLPEELLRFLVRAAEYYFHPIGEVLRAAAPAMPKEVLKRLKQSGFIARDSDMKGAAMSTRRTTFVAMVQGGPVPDKLGARQQQVIDHLMAQGEVSVDDLRPLLPNVRAVLRALVEKGLVQTREEVVTADPFFKFEVSRDTPPELNAAQRAAVEAMVTAIESGEQRSFLLHGVTGSGKTEVYLHAIEAARAEGKGALLLVPEIALTPQLVSRFRARFGDRIAVLHSGLSPRERDDAWKALRSGHVDLAVGARSALFAPVPNLGIVVVDEEHDSSFKQEEGFRYQARDMALLRANMAGAVCVLGSATPSVEAFYLAKSEKLALLTLPDRATANTLPAVEVVDLARNPTGPSGHALLSAPLYRALERCLEAKGQAVLFLNRRGFASGMRCKSCAEVLHCPVCSVPLTEHKRQGRLRCHYCDFARPSGEPCPACHTGELERMGMGTEKLEDTLAEVFAPAKVLRIDRDTVSGANIDEALKRVRDREVDIVVGTQMVTKGHDLPGVTLVGVVLADQSLAFPDFRASERTYQLLSQVAGRAGRGDQAGHVVFQTYQPDHPAVRFASRHDYHGFFASELTAREELQYAPFARLVAVRVDAGDQSVAQGAAGELARVALAHPAAVDGAVRVLGPAPAPIERLRGRYRFRLLLRSANRGALRAVAAVVLGRIEDGLGAARASVDVDPVSML